MVLSVAHPGQPRGIMARLFYPYVRVYGGGAPHVLRINRIDQRTRIGPCHNDAILAQGIALDDLAAFEVIHHKRPALFDLRIAGGGRDVGAQGAPRDVGGFYFRHPRRTTGVEAGMQAL